MKGGFVTEMAFEHVLHEIWKIHKSSNKELEIFQKRVKLWEWKYLLWVQEIMSSKSDRSTLFKKGISEGGKLAIVSIDWYNEWTECPPEEFGYGWNLL